MNLFVSPVFHALLRAFAAMLLHSLWQGLLLGIAAAVVILCTRQSRAVVRYNSISLLLLLFVTGCVYTFFSALNTAVPAGTAAPGLAAVDAGGWLNRLGIPLLAEKILLCCTRNATVIVLVWFAFFVLKCLHIGLGFAYINRIKRNDFRQPDSYWQNTIEKFSQQLGLKKAVLLLESGFTKVPLVIGHLKPVIYMPLGLLNHLPHDQVEAVLLHELAHIRRNDYLVNIIQQVTQTVFFFNPGFLWVAAILKREREHCCDDVALDYTQARKPLVEALVSFTRHSLYGSAYTTAFPGIKSQLMQRVMRITYNRNHSLSVPEKIFLLAGIGVCLVLTGILKNGHTPAHAVTAMTVTPVPDATTHQVIYSYNKVQRVTLVPKEAEQHTALVKKNSLYTTAVSGSNDKEHPEAAKTAVEAGEPSTEEKNLPTPVNTAKPLTDAQQADMDRLQAARDRQQALLDREQAELSRQQAERDRQQAVKDREQAEKDRAQADRDRAQAEIDRKQAEIDRAAAVKSREKNHIN